MNGSFDICQRRETCAQPWQSWIIKEGDCGKKIGDRAVKLADDVLGMGILRGVIDRSDGASWHTYRLCDASAAELHR